MGGFTAAEAGPATNTLQASSGSSVDYQSDRSGLYAALHDFDCNQQHVLTFKKGQIVEVGFRGLYWLL